MGDSCPPGSVAGRQCILPCPGGLPLVGLPADRPPALCRQPRPHGRGRWRFGRWLLLCTHLSQALTGCWAIPRSQVPLTHDQGDCVGRPVCRGEMAGGAGRRGLSPGQQTHCTVVGLSVEECVPATLTFHCKHHILIAEMAEQCFHGQHCKSVGRAKPRSCWEPRPQLRGHGRAGRTGMEHLLGLVGRQPSCWHPLQKVSTFSGICSVVKKIWKSRARKKRGKSTSILRGHLGSRRISCSALVACRKQNTQRQRSVPRRPRGRARAWEAEAQALPWATGNAGGAPGLAAPNPAPNPGFQPTA